VSGRSVDPLSKMEPGCPSPPWQEARAVEECGVRDEVDVDQLLCLVRRTGEERTERVVMVRHFGLARVW
jgi:hypothetical protein